MTARINWEECRIIDDLDDITVCCGAYIDSEDVPYVKEYIFKQFEIDLNAYVLRRYKEEFQKKHAEKWEPKEESE